jgi:hypothetical protein
MMPSVRGRNQQTWNARGQAVEAHELKTTLKDDGDAGTRQARLYRHVLAHAAQERLLQNLDVTVA